MRQPTTSRGLSPSSNGSHRDCFYQTNQPLRKQKRNTHVVRKAGTAGSDRRVSQGHGAQNNPPVRVLALSVCGSLKNNSLVTLNRTGPRPARPPGGSSNMGTVLIAMLIRAETNTRGWSRGFQQPPVLEACMAENSNRSGWCELACRHTGYHIRMHGIFAKTSRHASSRAERNQDLTIHYGLLTLPETPVSSS